MSEEARKSGTGTERYADWCSWISDRSCKAAAQNKMDGEEDGNCDALGLLGDRVRNLCAFSIEAVRNHMSKSTSRIPGQDFRVPTGDECEALVAYMLSDLVAEQDERNR